ncbi:MAG: TRAP transporter small permease subunit [Proteobacteria bacterium]|nr:TRAP transporter small permease subunit [Pseudomonadota bacterium]MDA0976379.1 TRAP transporter small permease subunit [Pseudomonadota bacterium]MDA1037090.1 TRAP transporter small permease subunit [Pseudomonadota bacterium]
MKVLEKYINFVGEKISYLIPVMVVLMIFVIVSRYFFGIGRTDIQELVMYFHALVFLSCAGYVMNHDEHVRVDIFYRNATKNYKQKINFILGLLFLLPLIAVTFFYSLETIEASWRMSEASTEAGGLAYVYIQKTLIILFPLTLLAALINKFLKTKWK